MFKGLLQTVGRIFELNTYCTNSQSHILCNYISSLSGIKIFFKNFPAF